MKSLLPTTIAPKFLSLGLLLILLYSPSPSLVAEAHVWMMCPLPRQCFYESPLGSNDGDGEWRRAPCPFAPGNSPQITTVVAGETLCLRVREFVDHVGHFDINLATVPVGPGDEQSLFTLNLRENIPDFQNGTSFQQFHVDIPANITCDPTCTLQVRQWSDDLNWYYYACSDIQVVNRTMFNNSTSSTSNTGGGTCQDRITEGTCEWEAGTPRVRIMILSPILFLGGLCVWIIGVVLAFVISFAVSKCSLRSPKNNNNQEEKKEEEEGETTPESEKENQQQEMIIQQEDGISSNATSKHQTLRPVALLTVITIVYMISAGIATILLKTCNYSSAHGSELSF